MTRRILRILVLAAMVTVMASTTMMMPEAAMAQTPTPPAPHVDPDGLLPVYSGLALLQYYDNSLDYPLAKDAEGASQYLSKMPFANIPPALDGATSDFADNGVKVSYSLADLFQLWDSQNTLAAQSRLNEAAAVFEKISAGLPEARLELSQLEIAAQTTGAYLKVSAAAANSPMATTYNDVIDKIRRLGDMLDLLTRPVVDKNLLAGLLNPDNPNLKLALETLYPDNPDLVKALLNGENPDLLQQLLNSSNFDLLQKILNPTELTLTITPQEAFVGDEVVFEGTLTSQGKPLADRQITLLLNSANYLSATTDAQGRFQGKLKIPYIYVSRMEAQALYYPQDTDSGHYLGASSQAIQLAILFYQAKVSLQAEQPAYPGKNTAVTGSFDYGTDPVPSGRTAQLYLDDVLQSQVNAIGAFSQTIGLDPKIELGAHQVVAVAAADGRYAPSTAIASLQVTRALPVLDLNLPRVSFIPGWTDLSGKLTSAAGPLNAAAVDFSSGDAHSQLRTAADGTFSGKLNMGLGLGLLGAQPLTVKVQPGDPWNAPQDYSRSVFVVNLLGCGLLLAAVVLLGVYLPRRMRRRYAMTARKTAPVHGPVVPAGIPLRATSSEFPVSSFQLRETSSEDQEETDNPVIATYRWVLKQVQALTRAVFKPSMTLREYAAANGRLLGPLSKPFLELTLLVERKLYSRHQTTPAEIEKSQGFARLFKGEKKAE